MKTNKLKQQKGTLLRVLQYVKPYRVLVIVSLLCACVSAAAQLLIPILTGKAIDQMIGAGQVNLSGVLVFAVWIAVVAALSAIAQQFLATSNNKIAYNISRDLRNAAMRKIQTLLFVQHKFLLNDNQCSCLCTPHAKGCTNNRINSIICIFCNFIFCARKRKKFK